MRAARKTDAAPCIAIVREAAAMRPRTIMTTVEEVWGVREWRRRMLDQPEGVTLVAEIEGSVVGLLGASRGDRPITRHAAELGITIAAAVRGIGVGRALMLAFEQWARGEGVERAVLGVYESNLPAQALYASLGYQVEGVEQRNVKFPEGYISTIRMAKSLL